MAILNAQQIAQRLNVTTAHVARLVRAYNLPAWKVNPDKRTSAYICSDKQLEQWIQEVYLPTLNHTPGRKPSIKPE